MSAHDTPEERDAKAEAIEENRVITADVVAKKFTAFKWEVRGYMAIGLLYIISQIF